MSLFPAPNATTAFTPTRAAGLERLNCFLPSAGGRYADERNADYGPDRRHNVSTLSPYVRHRLVTEPEVLRAVLARFAPSTAEKFIQEVYWRAYFKGYLETFPQIWERYRAETAQLVRQLDRGELANRYQRAVEGRTGIDCFDAWVGELLETGYLHNHTRMWFASIWIFTLGLPWQLGADFTYRHFIDGDPASNTLSWRWVGGLHTKGKTYLARRDNIERYTGGRFSPKMLAREAPALEEVPMGPARRRFPAQGPRPDGPVLLLVTEEDLHPETLPLEGVDIVAILGAPATDDRSSLPIAEPVRAFVDGALADGLSRAERHFGLAPLRHAHLHAEAIAQAARAAGARAIVTAYATTGPVAEALTRIRPALATHGLPPTEVHRPYDLSAWPYANKGFFALKERIPELIAGL